MIKLAFTNLAAPNWSLEQVIAAARRYGYDGVELRLLDGEVIGADLPRDERARVRRLFNEAGLPIVAVDTSIRLASTDDPQATGRDLARFLELAHDWRAPLLRVFGGPWPEGASADQAFARVARLVEQAVPAAERLGVAIALETHDTFSSAKTVAEVLRRVPSPSFGALWDTHHPYRMDESPREVLSVLDDRILLVHVKDARRRDDGWELVLLGEGEVPVKQSVEALQRHGYDGWISVEWEKKWHPEIAEPEVALPQHSALLRAWLARAGAGHREE